MSDTPYRDGPGMRLEWILGQEFIRDNGGRSSQWYFVIARSTLVLVMLAGAWACWRWSTELYGEIPGLLALVLWVFSPEMLAWGATICPDAFAASIGLIAFYSYWHWLRHHSGLKTICTAILLGLTLLSKTTWIINLVVWPSIWFANRALRQGQPAGSAPSFSQLILVLVGGIIVLNIGYLFHGTFTPLGNYHFVSQSLSNVEAESTTLQYGNKFRDSWLGMIPIPLPSDYIIGIDLQRMDFEQKKWSYLAGEWKYGGWWYFYIYALAVKLPVGSILMAGIASFAVLSKKYRAAWRDELTLLIPGITVIVFVSSQTGFSCHPRYILLALPFGIIFVSKIARACALRNRWMEALICLAAIETTASSILTLPYSMSHFNWLVGGPRNGYMHLVDGGLDWGQDLLELQKWIEKHPAARPLKVDCVAGYDIRLLGIDSSPIEPLQHGWYAISLTRLLSDSERYSELRKHKPIVQIGYSINIYRIDDDRH